MTAPYFSNNDSDVGLLEEIIIQERTPPAAIAGVNLTGSALVGTAIRGPVGKAVLIGSPQRFADVFGGRDQGSGGPIASELYKMLMNKKFGSVYAVRVAAAAAVAATKNFSDAVPTAIVQVDATSVGAWGNLVSVAIQDASDGDAQHFNLVATYLGAQKIYKNIDLSGTNDNTLTVVGDDDANWIKLTKLASGRPVNVTATPLTTGSDGIVADSDYTATGKGLEVAAAAPSCGVVACEHMSAAIKAKMATLAAAASDRLFLVAADNDTVSNSSAITDVATLSGGDRLVYCFNHPYTLDSATATEVVTSPCSWAASLFSQFDVDEDLGVEDTKKFLAGITRLSFPALSRSDYIALRAAGIMALEKDDGYDFVSAVTTSLTPGKERITRRRSTDYLQISLAKALKHFVKQKNTLTRRKAMAGAARTFLKDLQAAERIIDADSATTKGFLVDGESLNTDAQRALGIEKLLVRVRLLSHMLTLVVSTEIGESVTITEAA